MTKITLNVILSILEGSQRDADQGDYTERAGADESTISALHRRLDDMWRENIRMIELHVDLKNATAYLVSLFEETGQIYSCTRTKLGKLLAIAAFRAARDKVLLFDAHVYGYNQCGAIVDGLKAFTNMEAYLNYEYKDGIKTVYDDYNKTVVGNIDLLYGQCGEKYDAIAIIRDVFIQFGAYSAGDLGECINAIVTCDGILTESGRVDLEKVSMLALQDVNTTNSLIDYLFTDEERVDE